MNMQKRNSVLVKYKNIFTNYKKEERAQAEIPVHEILEKC